MIKLIILIQFFLSGDDLIMSVLFLLSGDNSTTLNGFFLSIILIILISMSGDD